MYGLLRLLAAPIWLVFALAVLAVAPALALVARLAGRITGRPEPVALIRLLLVYVTGELGVLLSPAASHEQRLRQLTTFLDEVVHTALKALRVSVRITADPEATAALEARERPLLVFSRHAGPGDSVLLVHMLLGRFGREPGIVMKEILTLDPVVGLIARHLPSALIDGAVDDADEIFEVGRSLGPAGVLLLFPEGGNFNEERRARAIEWLRRNGEDERAARAERLEHVIAPRPRGVLAAMSGAPGADVIFTAHTGLGRADSPLRILRDLPRDTTVRIRVWHVPNAELPRDDAARVAWLDDWWAKLDAWVEAQGTEATPGVRRPHPAAASSRR
jgi:1-acyl-sn-glycerol-3-phosphate acyltransferase